MENVIITTSWDDGSRFDLKLARLLKRYDIPATFYLPIINLNQKCLDPCQIKEIAKDFDVGGHTFSHVNLTRISLQQAEKEIIQCKRELENIIGRELVAFCYPWGAYNNRVIDIVKNAGFKGARTTRCFRTQISNLYEIGTTLHAHNHLILYYIRELIRGNNWKLFRFLTEKNLLSSDWSEIAMGSLNYVKENGGIWHLWGHSWDIERHDDWEKLEDIFRGIEETASTHNLSLMDNSQLILNARADKRLNLDY